MAVFLVQSVEVFVNIFPMIELPKTFGPGLSLIFKRISIFVFFAL